MQNIFGAVSQKWKMRATSARKKMWDSEYASGFGDLLKLPEAVEHNLTLVDFMTNAKKNTTILDVCCGEGILLDCLERSGYERYVGFDFSDVALKNASKRATQRPRLREELPRLSFRKAISSRSFSMSVFIV